MTIREIYEHAKKKGDQYLDCPVLLQLPYNTTLDSDVAYEVGFYKTVDFVDGNFVYVIPCVD